MTISRTHAIIQRTAGRLQLVDKRANVTVYLGERIKQGNAVDLVLADSFEILDFKLSIGRVKPDPSFWRPMSTATVSLALSLAGKLMPR